MTLELPAGSVLTVTADRVSAGSVQRIPQSGSATAYDQYAIAVSSSVSLGPYTQPRNYDVQSANGRLTYSIASPDVDQVIGDTAGGVSSNATSIAAQAVETIAANTQAAIFGALTVLGRLTVAGELRVVSWPT